MEGRLPAHLEVSAILRAVDAQGGFATVIERGERDAGTILLLTMDRGHNARLWERMPQLDGSRPYIVTKTQDPEKTKKWYEKHLGVNTNEYGVLFEFRRNDAPEKKGHLQWSPFSQDTTYFKPSAKDFMINYRVDNLEGLLEELKKEGVEIVGELDVYEYGKFAHIMDLEGNKIELWEPVDEFFSKEENK